MAEPSNVPLAHDHQQQHEGDNDLMTATNTAANTARNSPSHYPMVLPQHDEAESEAYLDGPSQPPSEQSPQLPSAPPEMPQTQLTFLLISGKRRTMSFEPDTTVGRVKELVWNAWPSDWQNERPPAPSYLRILYLGKILQDEDTLSSHKLLPSPSPPTIVHLSVRQVPIPSDSQDPIKKNKKRMRNATASGDAQTGGDNEAQDEDGSCCSGCVIS